MQRWARRGLAVAAVLWLSLSAAAGAAAQEYVIGPRDVLTITVWGQGDLSRDYAVDADGFVPFPLVGRVRAAGSTSREFATRLRDLLEQDYLVNPQVIVAVKEYLSKKVHVLGEAERPGVFYLSGPTTVLEVLSKAGGLAKTAGSQVVLVRKPRGGGTEGNTLIHLDFARIRGGDPSANLLLEDEDTVFVPRGKGTTFFVLGEVKKPGSYRLEAETSVLEAITIAGGFTDKAAPGRTRILRNNAQGQEVIPVDMNDVIKRGQRDRALLLRENDVVVVPESFF